MKHIEMVFIHQRQHTTNRNNKRHSRLQHPLLPRHRHQVHTVGTARLQVQPQELHPAQTHMRHMEDTNNTNNIVLSILCICLFRCILLCSTITSSWRISVTATWGFLRQWLSATC
jgi:hypothetical protein